MEFVAVDVETANADYASICQIGIAHFDETGVSDSWATLIDPEDYFDGVNVSIHGITGEAVRGAPRFPDILPELKARLSGQVVVHHMPFDRVALARASERYGLPPVEARWLDSARVARRAWSQFAERGYGLSNIAREFGIPLDHHDALSDATASGFIVRKAIEVSGTAIHEWLLQATRPIAGAITRSGDPAGPLFGECVVFTGVLSMPRRTAAEAASEAGCDVANSVSRKVSLLVVGTQDLRRTSGQSKSSKHRKAEKMIEEGWDISIIGEEDFLALVKQTDASDLA